MVDRLPNNRPPRQDQDRQSSIPARLGRRTFLGRVAAFGASLVGLVELETACGTVPQPKKEDNPFPTPDIPSPTLYDLPPQEGAVIIDQQYAKETNGAWSIEFILSQKNVDPLHPNGVLQLYVGTSLPYADPDIAMASFQKNNEPGVGNNAGLKIKKTVPFINGQHQFNAITGPEIGEVDIVAFGTTNATKNPQADVLARMYEITRTGQETFKVRFIGNTTLTPTG